MQRDNNVLKREFLFQAERDKNKSFKNKSDSFNAIYVNL